jgi:transposase-like protein
VNIITRRIDVVVNNKQKKVEPKKKLKRSSKEKRIVIDKLSSNNRAYRGLPSRGGGGGVAYKYLNAVYIKIRANRADIREARSIRDCVYFFV